MHQLQSFGLSTTASAAAEGEQLGLLRKESFQDPPKWRDKHANKGSRWQSDFKHKVIKEPLRMENRNQRSWVNDEFVKCQSVVDGMSSASDASLPSLIWACSKTKDLSKGAKVHDEILKRGLDEKKYSDALVTMYANCGELQKAQTLLDMYHCSTTLPWNALIASYARKGQGQNALDCFEKMQHEGVSPNALTYVCTVKACAVIGAVDKGNQIHDEILRQGLLEHSVVLGGALVDMYAKCGALSQAHSVLEELPSRNVVSWSALIAGYAQNGQGQKALECFKQMKREGIPPNAVTYVSILKACSVIRATGKGKQIHNEILRQGMLEHSKVLGGALVDMYATCGAFSEALGVLKQLSSRDVASWNALITGYVQKGHCQQALNCFEQIQHEGISPNPVTYVCVIKACAMIGDIEKGKQIHKEITRQGLLEHNVVLGGALVDMYAKCDALHLAQGVLETLPSRSVVCWSALITAYVQKGQVKQALECFEQMQQEGIPPDEMTYMCILKACAVSKSVEKGKHIHDEITRQGLLKRSVVLGGALVDMYAKCGALSQAQSVLEKLPSRNVVCWSALITGYVQEGQGQQALNCFERMERDGILPDAVTYVCILKACAVMRAIGKGKQIHYEISRQGLLEHSTVLGGALVDMYVKCGALSQAQSVLEELPVSSAISWNALITGYAQEGQGEQAFQCFEKMQLEGILPDRVTLLCLLNLCSHLGLVEKGHELFDNMEARYGLMPDEECFTCLIDLLGRAGHLVKAVKVIQEMPFSANSAIWRCLLGACRKWANVDVGIWAFEQAVELDECDDAAYVLMVNIYTAAGMREKAKDIEAMRTGNKGWKQPGCSSWTNLNTAAQEFSAGDTKHAQSKEMCLKLREYFS